MIGGSVRINSSNPFDSPIINPGLLAEDLDLAIMREAIKSAKKFVTAPAWNDYIIAPFGGLANTSTDADLESYARSNTATIFHPVGTSSMTPANAGFGVVDPDLRVKGVHGLRIVDASVMVRLIT